MGADTDFFARPAGVPGGDHATSVRVVPDALSFDTLYRDAVELADRARGWFDGPARPWRAGLSPDDQAAVATESLAITARLIAVMAWLLDARGGARGHGLPSRPFTLEPGADLPPGSALQDQPGGDIARASRHLVARLFFLARPAAGPPATAPEPGHWIP